VVCAPSENEDGGRKMHLRLDRPKLLKIRGSPSQPSAAPSDNFSKYERFRVCILDHFSIFGLAVEFIRFKCLAFLAYFRTSHPVLVGTSKFIEREQSIASLHQEHTPRGLERSSFENVET